MAVLTENFANSPIPGAALGFTRRAAAPARPSASSATTAVSGQASITASANSSAGSYTVTASAAGVAKTAAFSLTNSQASATIVVTPYNVTYDGASQTATGTAVGIGGANLSSDLHLSNTTHTNAGTYSDTWTFSDSSGNYARRQRHDHRRHQ